MFPLDFVDRVILSYTEPGQRILDPSLDAALLFIRAVRTGDHRLEWR